MHLSCITRGLRPTWRTRLLMPPVSQHNHAACRAHRLSVVATYPVPETEKEPSTIDTPQEWVTPQPSKRPDIFPDLEKLETPLPNALPGDPELPEDEEWDEMRKKLPEPDKRPPEPGEEPKEDEEEKDDEEEIGEEEDGEEDFKKTA